MKSYTIGQWYRQGAALMDEAEKVGVEIRTNKAREDGTSRADLVVITKVQYLRLKAGKA